MDKYDIIFNGAIELVRASKVDDEVADKFINSVGLLLFTVINEWERSDRKIPDAIIDAAVDVSDVWQEIVVAAEVADLETMEKLPE